MKQMTSGKIAFVGILALAGCYSYASESINNANYNTVQATPQYAVVKVGDSDQMIMRLVNDANSGALTSYTLGAIPAGILVHYNAAYRPVFDAKTDTLVNTGDKTAQQYFIVGVTPGIYSFTVTPTSVNTGISATVKVAVTPRDLGAALSATTAAVGDTITITAPAGTVFSQTSAITFATGPTPVIVSRAPDSTSFRFIVGSGTSGVGTVTLVGTAAVPQIAGVTIATTNTLVTPATPTNMTATFSTLTPALGAPITITLPTGLRFDSTSTVTVFSNPTTDLSGSIVSFSTDSTSIVYQPNPSSNGFVKFNNIKYVRFPSFLFSVTDSAQTLHVLAPTVVPTTVSNLTPAVGVPVTLTLGGNLRFTSTTHVLVGGVEGGFAGVSADSSTASFTPMGNSSGLVTYTNVVLSNVPSVLLALPGDKSITTTGIYGGATDPTSLTQATAPTVALPTVVGQSVVITDSPPFGANSQCAASSTDGCKVYKIVLTGTATFDLSLVWKGGADLGLYRLNAAGTTATSANGCDLGGQGASGQPELCTYSALAAGTYFLAVDFFGVNAGYPADANTVPPAWFQFRVTKR